MAKQRQATSKKTAPQQKVARKKSSKKSGPAKNDRKNAAVIKSVKPPKTNTSSVSAKKSLKKSTSKKSATKKATVAAPAGYSGTPLIKKLGIKSGTTLTLLGEPPDFLKTLGGLPDNLKIKKTALGDRDLTIWFPRNAAELKRRIKSIAGNVNDGGLWIAWPKKSSGVTTDLTQTIVRELGLKHGIVDFKICAIDETYSGLKFASRKR